MASSVLISQGVVSLLQVCTASHAQAVGTVGRVRFAAGRCLCQNTGHNVEQLGQGLILQEGRPWGQRETRAEQKELKEKAKWQVFFFFFVKCSKKNDFACIA